MAFIVKSEYNNDIRRFQPSNEVIASMDSLKQYLVDLYSVSHDAPVHMCLKDDDVLREGSAPPANNPSTSTSASVAHPSAHATPSASPAPSVPLTLDAATQSPASETCASTTQTTRADTQTLPHLISGEAVLRQAVSTEVLGDVITQAVFKTLHSSAFYTLLHNNVMESVHKAVSEKRLSLGDLVFDEGNVPPVVESQPESQQESPSEPEDAPTESLAESEREEVEAARTETEESPATPVTPNAPANRKLKGIMGDLNEFVRSVFSGPSNEARPKKTRSSRTSVSEGSDLSETDMAESEANQPSEEQLERFAPLLRQLAEMGFSDKDVNLRALYLNDGDLSATLIELLAASEKSQPTGAAEDAVSPTPSPTSASAI